MSFWLLDVVVKKLLCRFGWFALKQHCLWGVFVFECVNLFGNVPFKPNNILRICGYGYKRVHRLQEKVRRSTSANTIRPFIACQLASISLQSRHSSTVLYVMLLDGRWTKRKLEELPLRTMEVVVQRLHHLPCQRPLFL